MRNVLLVGAGYISDIHAQALRDLSSVNLWGVTDVKGEAAAELARRWSIPRVFPSIEAGMATGEAGCVHILTPPDTHHSTALASIKAGIPVLIEKPLATTSADCEALNLAATKSGTNLGVNQNFVFHPA